MTEGGRVIGGFSTYSEFLEALRTRVNELDVSGEVLDELSGLPKGYVHKLLGPRPTRGVGVRSLAEVLGALGCKCLLVEDASAMERISNRLVPRDANAVRNGAIQVLLTRRFMQKIGRKGGASRKIYLEKKRMLIARAQNAANVRWRGAVGRNKIGGTEQQ